MSEDSATRLARAVLLFLNEGAWSVQDHAKWVEVTGAHCVTRRSIADLACKVLHEQGKAP